MEEFPGNSLQPPKPGTDGKRVEKVVTSTPVLRKRPLSKRFLETFIAGDPKDVARTIFWEVMLPAAKDMVVDSGQETLHRVIYGESRPRGKRSASGWGSGAPFGRVAYNKISEQREPESRNLSRRARAQHDFSEVVLPSRAEAERVLSGLYDILSQFEQTSVADFYDLLGITEHAYTDQKYGWTDLSGSQVTLTRGGYLINLPRPVVLD